MGLRPGKTKGPYVGIPGSSVVTSDELVKTTNADTTAQYLDDKIVAGANITKTLLNPGGVEQLQLDVTAGGTVVDGVGVDLVTLTSGVLEFRGLPTYWDDFDEEKPFWSNTEALDSGDFQIDTANQRLEGIAENNSFDRIRYGIEGNFDYALKLSRNSATSIGIFVIGGGLQARISKTSTSILMRLTGEANKDIVLALNDPFWLRMKRFDDTIFFYYKQNDLDGWTLADSYTDADMGPTVDLALDSCNTGYVHEMYLYDNMYSHDIKASFEHVIDLTDAATISIDAAEGNIFAVTLGGNRQLGNPTNPNRGQKIIVRVTQDGTGSRTLSFDTDYRFSTDLPSPTLSTGAGATDYLGFIYNKDADKWDYIAEVKGF